jgi:ParB family chromosome partitioning protein
MTDLKKLPVKQIALDKLALSAERNVRRMIEEPIEPLAAAIAACGLLQNLVVHPLEKGLFGVCAGGRRLAALQHNRDAGLIPADHKVNCVVVDVADARQVSLAENFSREAMNPADEARAFAELVAEGRSYAEIAAVFGQTERYVRARERLGRLAAPVFDAFARRELSIEQAQAFAVADDQTRQTAVFEAWGRAPHWERAASHIRTMMTEDRVRQSDPRARLVGREAYVAAGGAVDEDLFGEMVYYLDAELLTRLAQAALDAAVDAEIATGWRWGATMLERDWAALRSLQRLYAEEVALSAEDQARWDEIEALLESEEIDDETYDALEAERAALQDRMEAFTDAQKAVSGVVAILTTDGAIAFERGLQRPEDVALARRPATADDGAEGARGDDGHDGENDRPVDGERPTAGPRVVLTVGGARVDPTAEKPKTPRDPYSAALRDDLRTALKGALQIAVAENPALARDLLEFETVMHALAGAGWRDGVLQLRVTASPAALKHDGWTYDAETEHLPGAAVDAGFLRERDIAKGFAAFTALAQPERDALLAMAVASSVHAALPEDQTGLDYATDWRALAKATARLSRAAQPELRRIWTPTAENFLGRVSKAVLLDIVEATLGAADARLLMGAKKGELVEHLHGVFNDEGPRGKLSEDQRARLDAWLPSPVTTPDESQADAGDTGDAPAADDHVAEVDANDENDAGATATSPIAAE